MLNRREYLLRLEAELGKTLPSEEVDLLVAEASGHLDDSVQARLELGLSQDDAEREALVAFGLPKNLTQVKGQARAQWLGTMFLLIGLLSFVPPQRLMQWSIPVNLAWLIVIVGYAYACWTAQRPTRLSHYAASCVAPFIPVMYVVGLHGEGFGHACRSLLYEGPRHELTLLSRAYSDSICISSAQGMVETAYEQRFALGALFLTVFGIDFLFGTAAAYAAKLQRRRLGELLV